MTYKKMTEKDWIEIGDQAKKVEEELTKLLNVTTGKMPVNIVDHIIKSSNQIYKFKSKAEDRMIQKRDSERLDIFYGEREDKES